MRDIPNWVLKAWTEHWEDGLSLREVAEEYKINITTLCYYFKKYKLRNRNISEAMRVWHKKRKLK